MALQVMGPPGHLPPGIMRGMGMPPHMPWTWVNTLWLMMEIIVNVGKTWQSNKPAMTDWE